MEVKGTHNPKFSIGALCQLGGWMDEANADENIQVKGIFVGNAARNDTPQIRGKLFEKNNENYALIKEIVIVRSMDLYCLTVLKLLDKLDVAGFLKELYACKGSFDAGKYWEMMHEEYRLPQKKSPAEPT